MEYLLKKFIRLNNYNVADDAFKEYFLSHPDYPNLSAIENTLNYFQIENLISQFEREDFESLPEVLLTSFHNNPDDLMIATKKSDGVSIVTKYGKKRKISVPDFLDRWSGVVVAIEKNEGGSLWIRLSEIREEAFTVGVLGIFFLYSLIHFNLTAIMYNALSLAGVFSCLEIYRSKYAATSIIINRICRDTRQDQESSCSRIMQSDRINIFGLKLSDIALFYFIAISVLGLFMQHTQFLLTLLSCSGIAVILYSLYIQVFREKTICKICISIILILLAQTGISIFSFKYSFSVQTLLWSGIWFLLALRAYVFINKFLDKNKALKAANITNLKFKRSYDIFKKELLAGEKKILHNRQLFLLGNKDAAIHISLIANLDCNFCVAAHEMLIAIYEQYYDTIAVQIRFSFSSGKPGDEKRDSVFRVLLSEYNKGESEFVAALDCWFKEKSYDHFLKKFEMDDHIALEPVRQVKNENMDNGLNYSPVFLINDYQFPEKYEREDLRYFIQDLVADEAFDTVSTTTQHHG